MQPTRVLVVDDNELLRQLFAVYLNAHGCQVFEAGKGADALEYAAADIPDVAVLDWHLNGESGYDLAVKLRAMHPQLPVIFLSGADIYNTPLPNSVAVMKGTGLAHLIEVIHRVGVRD